MSCPAPGPLCPPWLVLGMGLWLWALPAAGQDRLVVEEADPERAAHWRSAGRAWLQSQGVRLPALQADPEAHEGVVPERLAVLNETEAQLRKARAARAHMDESGALRELAAAQRALESDLALPGISRWLAEVRLHTGIVAAEMGRSGLARQAFRDAASLDSERRLQAAEAPPPVVELAWTAARELKQQPSGHFEVQVIGSAQPAEVYLDDVSLGVAPVTVQTSPGRHVLRVQAPGRRTYAALLDVFSGQRLPVRVQLTRLRAEVPPPIFQGNESTEEFSGRVRRYSRALPSRTVWWLRPSPGAQRASLWRCERGQCALSGQLDVPGALVAGSRPAPRDRPSPEASAGGGWRRAVPWVAAIVLVGAGLTTALVLTRPEPQRQQTVVLDPGDTAAD